MEWRTRGGDVLYHDVHRHLRDGLYFTAITRLMSIHAIDG